MPRCVPGGIRTHGPRIRNPVLYPAELRGLGVLFKRLTSVLRSALGIRDIDWGHHWDIIARETPPRQRQGCRRPLRTPSVSLAGAGIGRAANLPSRTAVRRPPDAHTAPALIASSPSNVYAASVAPVRRSHQVLDPLPLVIAQSEPPHWSAPYELTAHASKNSPCRNERFKPPGIFGYCGSPSTAKMRSLPY